MSEYEKVMKELKEHLEYAENKLRERGIKVLKLYEYIARLEEKISYLERELRDVDIKRWDRYLKKIE